MEGRGQDAIDSARRSLKAAFEYLQRGDLKTAASLFRAGARYIDRIEQEGLTFGDVVPFPLADLRRYAGGERTLAQVRG